MFGYGKIIHHILFKTVTINPGGTKQSQDGPLTSLAVHSSFSVSAPPSIPYIDTGDIVLRI